MSTCDLGREELTGRDEENRIVTARHRSHHMEVFRLGVLALLRVCVAPLLASFLDLSTAYHIHTVADDL